MGAGVATHGVAYVPNPDPNAPGLIVEGGATVGGETWGETFADVSAQSGEGGLAGDVKASLYTGTRADIRAGGYELVDVVQVPRSYAQIEVSGGCPVRC
jgi:hypothetical protein